MSTSRHAKYAALLALGLAMAGGQALAQSDGSEPGHNQQSNSAGNIEPGSPEQARQLPSPQGDDTLNGLLNDAKSSLAAGKTGEAQEALEQAETRALTRSVAYNDNNKAIEDPVVSAINQARQALGQKDVAGAQRAIGAAQAAAFAPAPNP